MTPATVPDRFLGLEPRQLTEDERGMLRHLSMWGSDGYPIRKLKCRCWTWDFRAVHSPTTYPTKREALAAFERYVELLDDLHAYEAWQRLAGVQP